MQTGRLGRILDDVLGHTQAPLATLMQIEEAIPYPTVVLAGAAATLAERIRQMLPADVDQVETARRADTGSASCSVRPTDLTKPCQSPRKPFKSGESWQPPTPTGIVPNWPTP